MYDSGTIALIANSHDHIPGFAWICHFKMKWPWHYFHVWTMFYSYTFSYNFFSMVDQDMQTRLNEQEWCWLCSWVFSSPKDSRDSPIDGFKEIQRPRDTSSQSKGCGENDGWWSKSIFRLQARENQSWAIMRESALPTECSMGQRGSKMGSFLSVQYLNSTQCTYEL